MDSPGTVYTTNHGALPESPPPDEASGQGLEKRASLPSRPNMAARHAKRLTLNFPILPPTAPRSEQSSPSAGIGTPGAESPVAMSPGRPTSKSPVPVEEPTDGADLLTAIASQERKVLEIREELQRAESELTSLKRQWALNERLRKRTEISYHAEAMKPLKSPEVAGEDTPKSSDEPGSATTESSTAQARISKELERRTSIRTGRKGDTSISANGRRVFHGSKHARTLSLLSPEMGVGFKTPSPVKNGSGQNTDSDIPTRHPRSATLPSVERNDPAKTAEQSEISDQDGLAQWRRSMPPPTRETLMKTGKQMASDLREGLWTFLEDIRQATVGEEGISGTESRTLQPPSADRRSSSGQRSDRSVTPSRSRERPGAGFERTNSSSSLSKQKTGGNKKSGKNTIPADAEESFWGEFGVDTPGQKSRPGKAAVPKSQNERKESADSNHLDVDDGWDAWDTPQPTKTHTPSSSRSTIDFKHEQSPSTQLSSPRTSARYVPTIKRAH
jgi:hypothetical protein